MGTQIELDNSTVHIESLKRNMKSFVPLYLQDIDTLIFQPEKPIPAISVDCNGDMYLRVDPKTKEIVGVEIEDFEEYFIVKYPKFAPIWKETKGLIKKQHLENENLTAFLTIVQELLNDLVTKQGCIRLNPVVA